MKHALTLGAGLALVGAMACIGEQDTFGSEEALGDTGDAGHQPDKGDEEPKHHHKHGPWIIDLVYDPDSVVKCPKRGKPATVVVCATAKGRHGDSLRFKWSQKAGPGLDESQPVVLSSEAEGRKKTECVKYTLPPGEEKKTSYLFKVTVVDKSTYKKASDSLKFPVDVICKPKKPPEPLPPDEACPRTIGFWGNHHELWPESFDPAHVLYGTVTWADVLPPAPQNGACGILGRQYAGANLNQAAGAFVPPEIQDALDEAEEILSNPDLCPSLRPSLPQGQMAIQLADLLDQYNQGLYASEECIDIRDLL
jgi:hypothetical protein